MSQFVKTYKDLKFWQTSKKTSLLVVQLIRELPNERIAWIISDQVLRSVFSIGANIAEGFGKYKGKEYPRYLQMALGSARETEYWLELTAEIYPQFTDEIGKILELNSQSVKMLIAAINSLRNGNKDKR